MWLPRSGLGTGQFCICRQDLAEVIYGVDGSPGALMSPFALSESCEAGSRSEPGWRGFSVLWGPEADGALHLRGGCPHASPPHTCSPAAREAAAGDWLLFLTLSDQNQ